MTASEPTPARRLIDLIESAKEEHEALTSSDTESLWEASGMEGFERGFRLALDLIQRVWDKDLAPGEASEQMDRLVRRMSEEVGA